MFLLALQNSIDQQYLQVFTTLVREETVAPYGFDWVGPDLELSRLNDIGQPDSTATIPMEFLSSTLWTGLAYAWDAGTYRLSCTGYDSLGLPHADSLLFAVGFGGGADLILDIGEVRLEVLSEDIAGDAMISLIEGEAEGYPAQQGLPIEGIGAALIGLVAGPVMVSPVQGILSFPYDDEGAGIFRWDGDQWVRHESFLSSGRILTAIEQGGIYALGEGPGVTSPEVPGEMYVHGTFPNPFTSATTILFSVPTAGPSVLRVYDLSGRLLRTLVREIQSPGQGSMTWDGLDEDGSQIPSGAYLMVLEAPGGQAVRRVVRTG